jgi:hypothetical protein
MTKIWTVMLAALAIASPAFGAEADLKGFLQAIEGTWKGDGTSQQQQWDGRRIETPYRLEVRARYLGANNWEVRNTRRTATGWTEYSRLVFGVRGDRLAVGTVSPSEFVELVETSPEALVYRFYRRDPRTGQLVRYTYDTRLVEGAPDRVGDPAPRYLDGLNTVEANGVQVAEDHFSLRK